MKSVLISIRPQWVEKITSGKKTIEVRKTAPQEVPFKCYIYETKGQYVKFTHGAHTKYGYGRGKVIGEFICNNASELDYVYYWNNGYEFATCLTYRQVADYGKGKTLYGWHISDLKIYDKPRELSEFCIPCKVSCENCKNPLYFECWCEEKGKKIVTRPPQSWCYVEDLGEEE